MSDVCAHQGEVQSLFAESKDCYRLSSGYGGRRCDCDATEQNKRAASPVIPQQFPPFLILFLPFAPRKLANPRRGQIHINLIVRKADDAAAERPT